MKRTVSFSIFAAIASISGSALAWAPAPQPLPQPPTAPNHPIFVCPPGFSSCGTPVNPPHSAGRRGAPGGYGNVSGGGGA